MADKAGHLLRTPNLIKLGQILWLLLAACALSAVILGLPGRWVELTTFCEASQETCFDQGRLTLSDWQAFEAAGISLNFYAAVQIGIEVLEKAVWAAVGLLIFARKQDDGMALWLSAFLVAFPVFALNGYFLDSTVAVFPELWLAVQGMRVTGEILAMGFFFLFPNGKFVPRWMVWVVPIFLARVIGENFFPGTVFDINTWDDRLGTLIFLFYLGLMVFSQVYRYFFAADKIQRYQIRWVVLGTAAGVIGLVSVWLFVAYNDLYSTPVGSLLEILAALFTLLIPISIGISVLRYRLFDIDVIIRKTLIYSVLTGSLALLYWGFIVFLQWVFRSFTSQNNQMTLVISTLTIAALFNPLRNRIQKLIDLRFYRKKYDAVQILAAYSASLREEVDLHQIHERLVSVTEETFQPSSISLWIKRQGSTENS